MSNRSFWLASLVVALLCGAIVQAVSVARMGLPASRPPFPIPGYTYVSSTRDGQADHSLFYFNLFGFGDRISRAQTLVIGSSHAQLGIEASMIGPRPFNMGLGGGEGLTFAADLLRRFKPHPSVVVVESFAPDQGLSTEAAKTKAATASVAFRNVLNIWSGFVRDWLLQGLLPRITISLESPSWAQPLSTTILRDWETADLTMVYSGTSGEVFLDASKGHPLMVGPEWPGVVAEPADLVAIKNIGGSIIVTTLPYPSYHDVIGRKMADDLGGRFVHVDPDDLRFFDYHHLNAAGRRLATSTILKQPFP